MSVPMPMARCPHCGKMNDAATTLAPGEQAPEEGDFSLCVYCLGTARYFVHYPTSQHPTLRLRKLTQPEIDNLPDYVAKALAKTRRAVAAFNITQRARRQ